MTLEVIGVLVVEDEAETARAHVEYVRRSIGFEALGRVTTAAAASHFVQQAARVGRPVDLLLLDMNLPDGHGLELVRDLRAAGSSIDVIAVTAVRELDVVQNAVALGIVQYLVKPFIYSTFAEKLQRYREYRLQLANQINAPSQSEIDRAFAALRSSNAPGLPKGLSAVTLGSVADAVQASSTTWTSTQIAEHLGLSRVTARRYLEYLADLGTVQRTPRYGVRGRPELLYTRTASEVGDASEA